ncbi:amino acid permease [Verrucomicrobiales bacterium BCK34]|nr:amino acid permease [Verrucomicrobiales bacterium BCK34]
MDKKTAKIGLVTATAIVVANMIGTGVFGSLGYQLLGIPSGFPIMVLWIIGGVVSLCGAVCYAEIASIFPKSGGEYHLLSRTWKPLIGFLAGWISVTVGFAAPIAANAALMGSYLGRIFEVPPLAPALIVVILVAIVHLGKIKNIGRFQSIFTYAKVALILVLGIICFTSVGAGTVSFLPQEGDLGLITSSSFAISFVYVLYAYTGWNAAVYMMDEVEKPEKTVPLALLIGTVVVTALYVMLNASFLYSTPVDKLAGEAEVGFVAAEQVLGAKGGMIMGILISFGLISTISSMTWAGPRVAAAMGRDHQRFGLFAKTNSNGIPALAIGLQSVIVVALVLSASFDQIIHYVQALLTISSLMVVAGVIYLRIKHPDWDRPYRAWAYPLTPLIFAAVSIYVLIFQIKEKPVEFLFGLGTMAIGIIFYFLCSRTDSLESETKS